MKITETMSLTKRSTDEAFYGEKDGRSYVIEKTHEHYPIYEHLYTMMRNTDYKARPELYKNLREQNRFPEIFDSVTPETPVVIQSPKEVLVSGIQSLMNFFTEFGFVPSFRFTNTFAYMCAKSKSAARTYVNNYFALMDSSYQKEVAAKVKSPEFTKIISQFAQYGKPTAAINTRFKVYYGSAGTGKTTLAQQEADNRCIVCNSSMLPSDLMEDFIFKDGQPDFNPSLLWNCMEQGKTIVLDEINLLPFDSLRFLQGIVDGKSEFYYKNRPVHIHDGFQIIGTMNLSLGGMTYGLPEPLVDRCSDAREFVLSAEQLAKAIIGYEEEGK